YEYNPSGTSMPGEKTQNPCKILIRENEVLFENLNSNETIEIFDVKGVLIHKSAIISEATYKYNIEILPSGIYFWHVRNTRGNGVKGKIIIAR
ncbi:MAG: T9SS type A sorting domain-containing protein, partial [candidate division WOR-3 bacterium]